MTKTQVFLRLASYLKPYWWAFGLVVVGFAIGAVSEVVATTLFKTIIDAINDNNRRIITWFPFLLIAFFFMRGLGSFLGSYYSALMARHLVYRLRIEVFDKLLKMPTQFYLDNPSGTLSSKLIFDVEQVTGASNEAMITLLKDGLKVVALFGYLFYSNWRLTLVLMIVLPPMAWVVNRASKRFAKLAYDIQDSMAQVSQITNEVIVGYQVVKNYGGQAYEAKRFNVASLKNLKQAMKIAVIGAVNTPLVQLFLAVGACFIIWIALRPEVLGLTTAGEFVSYLLAIGMLNSPIKALTDVNAKLQRGIAAGYSVFGLIDAKEESDKGTKTPTLQGNIEFCSVGLSYGGTPAISEFNLSIKAGETIAIVGRSGAGKTSLVNLLTATTAPTSGQILLDGIAIDAIALDCLRRQIAMVNQQVILFDGSIKDNIAYGALSNQSDEAILRASQMAYAHEFIQHLPQGYDTNIGADGLKLSGGQRQRLSIARALLKSAPILILDEATSALDNESEFFIQQALTNMAARHTTIVIAHRLATIEQADRIVVMDKGRIVELGTHEQLLAKAGHYAMMYERNFLAEDNTATLD